MEISRLVVELLSLTVSVVGSATRPWWRLIVFSLCLYISAWTTIVAWGLRLLRVPSQLLTAPVRERKIAWELNQLKAKYEGLQSINRELERNHKIALNEHRQIQQKLRTALIFEVNKATQRSKLLKLRIRELEEQYLELQQVQQKASLSHDCCPPEKDVEVDFHSKTPILDRSLVAQQKQSTTFDIKPAFDIKPVAEATAHGRPAKICADVTDKSCMPMDHQSRVIAFVSSLFSASLSALVAVIAWHAQDPCLPLVVALFIVVGMSCVNVVRFVSKVSHLLGLDAVVLVSFNSFVLGTVSTPFLPYLAPRIMLMWWWVLGLFGLKPEIGE